MAGKQRRPRFVFIAVPTGDSGDLDSFGWRLAAANHRPLGRGVRVHADLDGCRAEAHRLRVTLRAPLPVTELDTIGGSWVWRTLDDDIATAVSVRPYARRVECQRAVDQFVAAARIADPDDGVVRYYGPHALRDFRRPAIAVPAGARKAR